MFLSLTFGRILVLPFCLFLPKPYPLPVSPSVVPPFFIFTSPSSSPCPQLPKDLRPVSASSSIPVSLSGAVPDSLSNLRSPSLENLHCLGICHCMNSDITPIRYFHLKKYLIYLNAKKFEM